MMLNQLVRLIWKRKSRNLLLTLEVLLSFVVVFAIAAAGIRTLELFHMPTGLATDNIWSIAIKTNGDTDVSSIPGIYDSMERGLRALPTVKHVAFATSPPFSNSRFATNYTFPGTGADINANTTLVSTDFFNVANLRVVQGEWFSDKHRDRDRNYCVINQQMAHALFGNVSPVGREIVNGSVKEANAVYMTVVGVVEDFRKNGEFDEPANSILILAPENLKQLSFLGMQSILVGLEPGTSRTFEIALTRQLKTIRNDWSFEITPLKDSRSAKLDERVLPLMIASLIACFLLLMVGFGLFGVLWQNTTQRIPEIGLRRAVGASSSQIYFQIMIEQILLSSLAIIVALALLIQLPLTGALGRNMDWQVFGGAALLSALVIYLLSLVCALYPGWRASRLSPTEALHYE